METIAGGRLAERLARARKEQAERGVDALLLGPSADLAYLTGYHPPHLERLTLLVGPAASEQRAVVKLVVARRSGLAVSSISHQKRTCCHLNSLRVSL